MRINYNYIKTFILLLLVVFLYAFSAHKHNQRPIKNIVVNFIGNDNLYISQEAVNKLLIQNNDSVTSVRKEILDLNDLEARLTSNEMIKSAEVYLTVNGEVKAEIEQKKPIARVNTNASYYIDEEGNYMPLSSYHTARVPLVTGVVEKNQLKNVFKIARKINQDEFLKQHIIEIHQYQNKSITLKSRVFDFEIDLGHLQELDSKINNFKAFYQKAKKDNALQKYSRVNLQYRNQVVCTKK